MQRRSKKLNLILKYLVASILLVIPLFPKFPLIKVPGTFVSVRIEDFLLVLISLVLLPIILGNFRKFTQDKINRAILIFLVVGFISLSSAVFITKTIAPHIGLLHLIRRIEYFVPFFLGSIALADKKNLKFYIKVLMVSIAIMFIYGLGQKYLQWPIIITQNQEYSKGVALRYIPGGHINSTFAGHYDLSTFLVFLLPVFISLLITFFQKAKLQMTTIVIFSVTCFGLWLLANSGSRISVVSYLLSTTVALTLLKKYKYIPLVILFSLVMFSFSSNLRARYIRIFKVTVDKIQEMSKLEGKTFEKIGIVYAAEDVLGFPKRREIPEPTSTPIPVFEDRSTSIRLNVEWPRALRALSKNPLLGTGYSSITLATDNDYLRLLGEVGILGFLAFFLILIRLGNVFISTLPIHKKYEGFNAAFLAGVIGGLIGVLINAVFIDVFEASKFAILFWLIIGLALSTIKNNRYE